MPFVLDQASPPAQAAPATPGHIVTAPGWLERPSAEQMKAFFPKAAALSKITGDVTIHCQIDATGALSACAVTKEAPPGLGFGEAAVAMAATFRMRPKTVDGAPAAGEVNIPIHFSLPPGPAPEPGTPSWISIPTTDDMAKAYPSHASHVGISGQVMMQCAATAEGEMSDCRILQETPSDEGFGRAALSISGKFRLTPLTPEGKSVAGTTINIPIAFRLPK